MGAYPNALYVLTGVCAVMMAALTLIWLLAYAVSAWWEQRRRRPAPRRPAPPALQMNRPRRYSIPPPYRPVSNRREKRW